MKRQEQEVQQQKTEATVVIQKWARGYLDRAKVRQIRQAKQSDIEEEYGYFEE